MSDFTSLDKIEVVRESVNVSDICIQLLVVLFTVDVEHSHVRFLGNLVLNLWDCGG